MKWTNTAWAVVAVLGVAGTAAAQTTFPQQITAPEGTILIYQPQPEKLAGNVLSGRAAMSLTFTGKKEPIFGAFWFTSIVDTDDATGLTTWRDIKVTKAGWPDSKPADEARFTQIVEDAAAKVALTFSTERFSASLADAEREQRSLAELKHDPPKIVFANQIALLLLYDGAPMWHAVENSPYERALNTPFVVVRDTRSKVCYLTSGTLSYSAKDALGPWQPIANPPADLVQMLPKPEAEDDAGPAAPPAIVVATEPTELVVTDGEPKWKPVGEGKLLYVENTETPLVREVATRQIYVLLSGRWFRAATTSGPWSFVRPDQLPESFKAIPAASDLGGVRVSVAGTDEAEDAVLDSAIPKTAAIRRSEAKFDVEFEGEPTFEQIPGTTVSRAVNTPAQILQIGTQFFAVDNGVWFVASSPKGPWVVADTVPEDQIQKIPPSSPAYNTTYVHVYQSTPEVVYVGYTPGYMWSFPYYGVPVYGTGWYYPAYPGYYYPRPYTWGFHVGYNPWTGWNFGVSWGGPFMRVGIGWGGGYYGPWGGYYRGGYYRGGHGGWYGGYRPGYHGGYHGGHNTINIGNNVNYGNRQRAANTLRNNPNTPNLRNQSVYNRADNRTRNADRPTIQRNAQQAKSARGMNNDVLADRGGNVARKAPSGWEARDSGKWQNLDRGAAQQRAQSVDRPSVQRDYQARQRGAQRESVQRRVPRSAPAARPSRGGGRRR